MVGSARLVSSATGLRRAVRDALPPGVRTRIRQVRSLARLAWREVRHDLLGRRLPLRPRAVSYMANDICNARCVMCGIWGRKRERELTPEEVARLAATPLFAQVRHVGITGGEPTLRRDLPALFAAFADHAPRLEGASIITNAVKAGQVRERVLASADACTRRGIGFSVMVSLDGLDAVHDASRGRAGNFASALACIEAFQRAGLQVSIGCTVTRVNVAHVDEVLDWAIARGIPARFRVAEFIDRLYNADRADVIRNFSALERHHLGLFFHRLVTRYESDSGVRATYQSIIGMLTGGLPRSIGCPHHTDTVVLDSRGGLLVCSPKSRILGNVANAPDPEAVHREASAERARLIAENCADCIHDYHVPVPFRRKLETWLEHRRRHRRYDCARLVIAARREQPAPPASDSASSVLIVGWYGTETAGDKAILREIVRDLQARTRAPERIVVSSFNPWFTRWTLEEMGIDGVQVLETCSRDFEIECESTREVIVGGGPLMDLEGINHMLYAAVAASRRGACVTVQGCGLGPLKEPRYREVVGELLRLASRVRVRDSASRETARRLAGIDAAVGDDPAVGFVRHWRETVSPAASSHAASGVEPDWQSTNRTRTIICCLRELPSVYAAGMDETSFLNLKARVEDALVDWIAKRAQEAPVQLLAMCTLADGGDDRRFNARLRSMVIERHEVAPEQVEAPQLPMSPMRILTRMATASSVLCMRYHSVLFARELGVPFQALDYTRGGKIAGYLADLGEADHLVSLEDFAAGKWP